MQAEVMVWLLGLRCLMDSVLQWELAGSRLEWETAAEMSEWASD